MPSIADRLHRLIRPRGRRRAEFWRLSPARDGGGGGRRELDPGGAELRAGLDGIVLRSLGPVLAAMVAIHLAFVVIHWFGGDRATWRPVALAELALASAFAVAACLHRLGMIRPAAVHPVGAALAGLVALGDGFALSRTGEAHLTTDTMLLVMAVGCFFLSHFWFLVVVSLAVAGWCAVSLSLPRDPSWLHFALGLGGAVTLSVLVHHIRVVTYRHLVALRLVDARQRRELEEAREQAEQASRLKGEFVATLSHEMRTPLNSVLGYATLLLDRGPEGEERDCVLMIQQAGQTLLALLNDVLDLSRIEAGRFEVELEYFDPRDLVEEVLATLRPAAEEKGIRLARHFAPGLPGDIRTDPLRLRQILVNLVGNAIKFTAEGEVVVDLSPVAAEAGAADDRDRGAPCPRVSFAVRDSGVGIRETDAEALFRPFQQVGPAEARREGSGLGLAISRRLCRLLGGEIQLRSQPGEGSTFSFSLPVGPPAPETSPAPAAAGGEGAVSE